MSTNGHIGIENKDGSVTYIYVHWDGYTEKPGVGWLLKEHYSTDSRKVNELMELGDLSCLGPALGCKHDFNTHHIEHEYWCLAYGRDRGEFDCMARTVPNKEDKDFLDCGYVYLYGLDGVWRVSENGKDFRELY